jgi:preprotein translocase subunit SecD
MSSTAASSVWGRRGAMLLVTVTLCLGACSTGSDSSPGVAPNGAVIDVPTADVAFRPVLDVETASTGLCPGPDGAPDSTARVAQCTNSGYTAYVLGPVAVDGSGITGAQAKQDTTGAWLVNPIFAESAQGLDAFNEMAASCYRKEPTCPTGQIAIVFDGHVVTAPSITTPAKFAADEVQISGDFTESQAVNLAGGMSP